MDIAVKYNLLQWNLRWKFVSKKIERGKNTKAPLDAITFSTYIKNIQNQ